MSERRDNPMDDPALSVGVSLRLAADGELSAEREARVASSEEARRSIAFERSLRAAVGRAMEGDEASEELRRRIAAALAGETPAPLAREMGVVGVIRRNWSLAAMILLAIGLGTIYLSRLGAPTAQQRRQVAVMASMLNDEGERYTGFGESFERHVPFKGEQGAVEGMSSIVGVEVPVRDLSALGLEVAGLAPCSLPWSGRTGQLIYRDADGEGWLTLIMNALPAGAPDSGRTAQGTVFRIDPEQGRGDAPVFMWREGDVVFYLVSPTATDARRALRALGAPGREKAFDPAKLSGEQYRPASSAS